MAVTADSAAEYCDRYLNLPAKAYSKQKEYLYYASSKIFHIF